MNPGGLPRRPLLRVFDLDPDRHRPVDASYVQSRWVRVHRPGPLRAALVVLLAIATTWVAMAGLVGVTAQRGAVARIVAVALAAAAVSVTGWATVRLLAAGTYVNDRGLRLLRMRHAVLVPWEHVVDVRCVVAGAGSQVVAVLSDGTDVVTSVRSRSLDFVGRPESYDMASLAIERWWSSSPR